MAPCACFAILPVSNVSFRPPSSRLVCSTMFLTSFSPRITGDFIRNRQKYSWKLPEEEGKADECSVRGDDTPHRALQLRFVRREKIAAGLAVQGMDATCAS